MDEKEELIRELQEELEWTKYRQYMLNIIEKKLFEMRQIAELAKQQHLTEEEIEKLNVKINNLASGVKALDEESRKL